MITHVVTEERIAALTFDDGPDPVYTPRLLEILDRFDVRATFFMVGQVARGQAELVKSIASRHVIANHSWDHPVFTEISSAERCDQLRACARALAPFGGDLFRPPYGREDAESRSDAVAAGYQSIGWSVDAEDWLPREPQWMAERLLGGTSAGSIILLHDSIFRSHQPVPQYDRTAMLAAVEIFLREVRSRLRFVTVPELLDHGVPVQ